MPRVRITRPVAGALATGTIVETAGPVTDTIQAWLTAGDAELLFERVVDVDAGDERARDSMAAKRGRS